MPFNIDERATVVMPYSLARSLVDNGQLHVGRRAKLFILPDDIEPDELIRVANALGAKIVAHDTHAGT